MLSQWYSLSPLSCAVALCATYFIYRFGSAWYTLSGIPTVGGPSLPLLSYIGGVRFLLNEPAIVNEGSARYKGGVFKLAALDGWIIVLNGRALSEELRKLPDSVRSFYEATNQLLQTEFIMSHEFVNDMFHVEILRTISAAFEDLIPASGDEWTTVPAFTTAQKIICRASNRMMLGPPLCRDPEWLSLMMNFTQNWFIGAQILRPLPDWLKRTVGTYFSVVPGKIRRGRELLTPIIEEHRAKLGVLKPGHPGRPDDFLAWMIEGAQDDPWRSSTEGLTQFIMAMNFSSIETTSIAFTNALYDLASCPEFISPLREEAEAVIAQYGWTKTSMLELHKADSFMRESNRIWSSSISMTRAVMKEHTFSNGVTVPAGTTMGISGAVHQDNDVYPNPDEFLPFRHIEGANEDVDVSRRLFVSPSSEYLPFGLGKHACPGRFFASHEIKIMLAHIVLNYDVRTEIEGVRPASLVVGAQLLPNSTANVLFRKRRA